MPRPGGEADKLGNRYEGIWTVGEVLDVASGHAASITVEPITDGGAGIEFVVRSNDGTLEYHSAKRQRAKGEWKLSALAADHASGRSVLGDLFGKLADNESARVCFVSSTGANELRELTERARQRKTLADFEADFAAKGDGRGSSSALRQALEKYVLPIARDWATAYGWLGRTRVALIDEPTLTRQIDQQIAFLVYRPDQRPFQEVEVRALLGNFVLSHLGSEIGAQSVWEFLNGSGYRRRDWMAERSVREQVERNNSEYMAVVETELINQARIPRDEARVVTEEVLPDSGARRILLSAAAGVGKSCVLAQVIKALDDANVPTLVVRLDRHGDARSPRDIGAQMELPNSPAVVLAGIANGGRSALVVDQLDSASQVSGRYPHLWEAFDALCREVQAYPNMRLIIACRDFDLQHDHRLRRLNAPATVKHIPVEKLSGETVEGVLKAAGIGAAGLGPRQKTLLQTPLHLFLFLDGRNGGEPDVSFQTIGDLFDRYWEHKERAVVRRLGDKSDWIAVVDAVCDAMSRALVLTVPAVALDAWSQTAAAMQTEHVLVRDGKQVRFFHESFFDYAFARRFCASGESVIALLRSSEQHLFRRSQVRQILSFLRDHDRARYLAELRSILTDDGIRFHIKRMVIAWLGTVSDPVEDEWAIISALVSAADYQRHILPAIRHSIAWFDLLYRNGTLAELLASPDPLLANRGLWFLTWDEVRKCRSEEAASLLSPYRGRSPEWNQALRAYFRWGHAHYSRPMQELFLQLIDDGVFDRDVRGEHDSWWHSVGDSAEHAPLFGVEALARWLDRQCARFDRSNRDMVFDGTGYNDAAPPLIQEVVRRAPEAYVSEILPLVARLVELAELAVRGGLRRDSIGRLRMPSSTSEVGDTILKGLVTALQQLAIDDPERFDALTRSLLNTEWDTIAFLLLRSWPANPGRFGQTCIVFLTNDPRRLDVGYAYSNRSATGDAAVSREAIEACLGSATSEQRCALEAAIRSFTPWGDKGKFAGWTERLLLESFGEDQLSESGQARLRELRSKFPEQVTALPKLGEELLPSIGTPVPREEAKKLSDDGWLDAMRRYNYGRESPQYGDPKGSAVELSQILEQEARADRRRFAALVNRMEDAIRAEYFDAILSGICGDCNMPHEEREIDDQIFRDLETGIILDVVRRLHDLPGRPCGRAICRGFERLSERQLSAADLDILRYYAIDDPDPSSDDWVRYNPNSKRESAEEANFYGYNSVRGQAARAIQSLLFDDYQRAELLLPVLRKMVADRSMAVRTCVVEALLPVLNHDRDEAVRLYLEACRGAELVYGSEPFEIFAQYATGSHYSRLRAILHAWLNSSSSAAAVAAGSRQICIAALTDDQAAEDAEGVRAGSPVMRRGAAEVYACNLTNKTVSAECLRHLPVLFRDESEEVRTQAASCFGHLGDADFNQFEELVRAYVESPSYPSKHDHLLRRLDDSTWQLPDVSVRLAERFIAAHGRAAGDISTAAAGDAPTVAKLVVRLYAQTSDAPLRSKCLDLIDEMERLGFYGIDAELMEHDR